MRIEIGPFGERIPMYETREENLKAIDNYLKGNYGELTADEIAFYRDCEEDPYNLRWERQHAGELLRVTEDEVEEDLFAYRPLTEPFAKSWEWLKATVGHHPIDPTTCHLAMKTNLQQLNYE